MSGDVHPFPGTNGHGRQRAGLSHSLPKMSPEERQLWANSHNLPAGMLLLYQDEVAGMAAAVRNSGNRLAAWEDFGIAVFKTTNPLEVVELLQAERAKTFKLDDGGIVTADRAVDLLNEANRTNADLREQLLRLQASP